VLVSIKDVHALVNPLCFHLRGIAEIVLGWVQLPSAGSAVQRSRQIIAWKQLFKKKKKSKTEKTKAQLVMERGGGTKRVSGELESSHIPCLQPTGPSVRFAVGQMAASREPRQMARAGRFASGA